MFNWLHMLRGRWSTRVLILLGAIVLVAIYYGSTRDRMPELPFIDTDPVKQAGECDHSGGAAFVRIAELPDFQNPQLRAYPGSGDAGWTPVSKGSLLFMGSLLRLGDRASFQFLTNGNWLIGLDGEGEYIFEDARRDEQKTVRTATWVVKKGMFRAKPHTSDKSAVHWLKVRTPVAEVVVLEGEIGLQIEREGQGGRIWRNSGKVVIRYNDGRRKELVQRGLDDL